MSKDLVIVESPAKANTLARFLGSKYVVRASKGHVRDLPKFGLGVDIKDDFAPRYEVVKEKRELVKDLKKEATAASIVYLATDPDREGEAISWHIVEAIGLKKKDIKRVVFHEITEEAVKEAFRHPRTVDERLVNAQQARRVLDRLVGYKLSPLLWHKIQKGLSAGRVQSAALRMVVDREREIQKFVPVEYWTIEAMLAKQDGAAAKQGFAAQLHSRVGDDARITIPDQQTADTLKADVESAAFVVKHVQKKEIQRRPAAPYTTSTLQQEASRRLGFPAQKTMAVAQQLYEGIPLGGEGPVGLITYMRTDSLHVAVSAKEEARSYIGEKFGKDYVPPHARIYTAKSKLAQEAHEAIRPTSVWREPAKMRHFLTREQFALYDLVWKRMVASQMNNALVDQTSVEIDAAGRSGAHYIFRASGSKVRFQGFLTLYAESRDDDAKDDEGKQPLPELKPHEPLDCRGITPEQHFTEPPPRFTEATLIKALEENGIGRPSTYAPIIATLMGREYVKRQEGRLHPQDLGMLVSDLLTTNFPEIVDPGFTAQMEDELDDVARGKRKWESVLHDFYGPFEADLKKAHLDIPDEAQGQTCEKCGKPMVVKVGRYGRFLSCSGYPECKNAKPINGTAQAAAPEPTDEVCEKCGKPMVIKAGRYGRFLSCTGYPECKNARPIQAKTGAKCPKCGGDILERRAKRAKKGRGRGSNVFYGCSNYPTCDFTVSRRPLAQPCPSCGGLLVASGQKAVRCAKCDYKGQAPAAEPEPVATAR